MNKEGYDDANGNLQSYSYNPDESFVTFGKFESCSEREIYTGFQFDPVAGTGLELNFKKVSFSVNYDQRDTIAGENKYAWGTNLHCWMRDSQHRRALSGPTREDQRESRKLSDSTYTLKCLPSDPHVISPSSVTVFGPISLVVLLPLLTSHVHELALELTLTAATLLARKQTKTQE